MSRFYVGQRVRIIHSHYPHRIGLTGTLTASGISACHVWRECTGKPGWFMDIDGIGGRAPETGLPIFYIESQIEPLNDYDGNTVTTWAATAWKPNQVRAELEKPHG